jgi:crotonobetainyl-CoA:carnitine CoA-transferase CaiB-like acyl-CoA transferase
MTADATVPQGPLGGLRVIDLGRIVAGPFCAMLLGDFGADVIKVETPPDGDFLRHQAPKFADDVGSYFATANRNKRSVMLDLRSAEGLAALRRLLADADVLVENFRPGVLEKMGLDEATLTRDFPRLVVARVAAYGHVGPMKDEPGVDQLVQGLSGHMAITGTVETGPIRSGIAICDILGALCATMGVLAALVERAASGRGQIVRTSLLEAMLGMMSMQAGKYFSTGVDPRPEGNHHPVIAPYGAFETSDGHVQLQVMHERHFVALAKACGRPEWLGDPRMNSNPARAANMAYVRETVARAIRTRSTAEWLRDLRAADVGCGPILTVAEAFRSAQALATEMVQRMRLNDGTELTIPGFPVKLSRTPAALRRPPPRLGEHTAEVLGSADAPGAARPGKSEKGGKA